MSHVLGAFSGAIVCPPPCEVAKPASANTGVTSSSGAAYSILFIVLVVLCYSLMFLNACLIHGRRDGPA